MNLAFFATKSTRGWTVSLLPPHVGNAVETLGETAVADGDALVLIASKRRRRCDMYKPSVHAELRAPDG